MVRRAKELSRNTGLRRWRYWKDKSAFTFPRWAIDRRWYIIPGAAFAGFHRACRGRQQWLIPANGIFIVSGRVQHGTHGRTNAACIRFGTKARQIDARLLSGGSLKLFRQRNSFLLKTTGDSACCSLVRAYFWPKIPRWPWWEWTNRVKKNGDGRNILFRIPARIFVDRWCSQRKLDGYRFN